MKSSNIIDFFTGQSYEEIIDQDTQENDKLAEKYGVYLGCLGKNDADQLKIMLAQLASLTKQINELTSEYEELRDEHQELLRYCLNYLHIPKGKEVNLPDDRIMVNEKGHVWAIYKYSTQK